MDKDEYRHVGKCRVVNLHNGSHIDAWIRVLVGSSQVVPTRGRRSWLGSYLGYDAASNNKHIGTGHPVNW